MAFHFSFHRLVVVGIRHSGAWRIYMPHRLSSLITLFSTVTERPSNPCGVEFSGSYRRSHYDGAHEEYILNELADLLPISQYNAVSNLFKEDRVKNERGTKDPDVFLSPEEKLRGIFLQKLKGKAALDRALTNAGVDVNIDVVAGVVNRGNLGGEAMVSFFRWAIERPTISRDTNSYNVIIKALGRRKFFGFMEEMLYEMSSNSVTPSLETLSIVMDSFVRARQVNRAIGVFRNMEEFGWKCVTDSLNVLLQTLCQRFHVGVANCLLNSVKGKIPFNLRTYNIIIGGWSKIGRVGDIERILEAMVADGFAPDCLTFAYVIEGLGRAGQIEDAVKIFDGMKEKGCEPDVGVYNAMLSNFAVVGDFDTCMNYYRSMLSKRCDPNIDTYRSLINFFLKFQKVADALEMFDEMLSRGLVPTTGMITSFIEPLCRYGPPYAAMMIYKKARKAGCLISLSAYKLLLVRLSRFGKCGMLLTLWDEMQEAGHSSDVEVYECIVNGLCNIGQLENAVLVMEESLRKGFCPCRRIYSKLNSKLLASNNNVEKAYKLFLKIKDARLQENARRYWRSNGWHF